MLAAHQGQEHTLQQARQCVSWPGITNDMINMVKSCNQCEVFKTSQAYEPLMQIMIPTRLGEAIAADMFSYMGREYLVFTDKYSGWQDLFYFGRQGVNS